ncbi:MAG TPA: tRNA pseudouridine(13) synthase TruD [Steroidobacteraceae bacterium]|nr:tRNA pseudouridine(13) synthase TruD [Steroidobacteraceae bacterium]
MLREALDPVRAYGAPLGRGVLRAEPEDFLVEEQLGFSAAGSGQHVLLKVRKRDANTQWVARELARACGCRALDVGYAGLKDRHAVALQWFTVPQSRMTLDGWTAVRGQGFEVLEAHAHTRKLPRGALEGNRFEIRIRHMQVDDGALATRLAEIAAHGVPNYFGPQRFGRDGANLARMSEDPRALAPEQRSFMLSAARSLVFNAVAAERVADGSWATLEAGDVANLDGRGSVFAVEPEAPSLLERCQRLELHPTGPLWGRGTLASTHRIHALELAVSARFSQACALTEQAGMEQERRALRLAVRDLQWQRDQAGLLIHFRLTRSGFATTVLREIVDYGDNNT